MSKDNKNYINNIDDLIDSAANEAVSELFDNIDKSIDDSDISFSENHTVAIDNILKISNVEKPHKAHIGINKKILLIAAVISIIVATAFSVDAVRNKFGEYFVNTHQHNTDLNLDEEITPDNYSLLKNKYKPDLGYIPQGFHLDFTDSSGANYIVQYIKDDKCFSVCKSKMPDFHSIDTEDPNAERIDINGFDGFFSIQNDINILTWTIDDIMYTVESNLDKETIVKIAENLK